MTAVGQLAVKETTAARMLDMTCAEFLRLVEAGALPPAVEIYAGVKRWRVADLNAILTGDARKPQDTAGMVV